MAAKPNDEPITRSQLDELLDRFEKLSPEERRRDVEKAESFLLANRIDNLPRFDEWVRR